MTYHEVMERFVREVEAEEQGRDVEADEPPGEDGDTTEAEQRSRRSRRGLFLGTFPYRKRGDA